MSISDIWYWLINADLVFGAMVAGGIIIAITICVLLTEAWFSLAHWWEFRNE